MANHRVSLRDFNSSLKTREVPITQAFHLYRKSRLAWFRLFVKVLKRCCILTPRVLLRQRAQATSCPPGSRARGRDLAAAPLRPGAGRARRRRGATRPKPGPSSSSPSSVCFLQLRYRLVSPLLANNSFHVLESPINGKYRGRSPKAFQCKTANNSREKGYTLVNRPLYADWEVFTVLL